MAAHLAGAVAAHASPVLGANSTQLKWSCNSFYTANASRRAVATFAAGTGATNAGIFAAQMIATTDDQMAERLKEFKELREKTIQKDKNLDRG